MASFSLGPARIIKIKTTITESQSQVYAIVLPLFCHPSNTIRIKYVLEEKKN